MPTPEIYVEMHLVFDNDFDVNIITDMIDVQPYECKTKSQTRINPLSNQSNQGFWTFRSEVIIDFDVKKALDELISKFEDKTEIIKEICSENKGNIYIDIVPTFNCNDTPAVYFDKRFLKFVNELDAEIELDIYALTE